MVENVDNLNGVYLGIVSLVCLLTYLAVSGMPAAKVPARRATAVLRSFVHSLLKVVHASRKHVHTT